MKILIHSNAPWSESGYGGQTAMFARKFRELGHDVAISTNWGLQGAGLEWDQGIRVYPSDNQWGNWSLPALTAHHADGDPLDCVVITLMDVYNLKSHRLGDLHIAAWTPVDHDPLPPRVHEFFQQIGAVPIAMSRFGERKLLEAGLQPLYVPHAVDTSIFKPLSEHRPEIRKGMGVPEDAFVVGMVARNQGTSPPRKAFPQVFQAFAEFRRKHTDAILYLHTEIKGINQGINLFALAEWCGLPLSSFKFSNQLNIELGIPQRDVASLLNGFDVLANPSYGEGFGIPIIEAQACGVPVIVTDYTAMPELCGAGWKVGGELYYDPHHGAGYRSPAISEIADAFEAAYDTAGTWEEQARRFALRYDVETVTTDYWQPVLTQLEMMLLRPREVGPLELQPVPA